MKLIINIPDEKYNDILHTHMNMRGIADNAIAMGTPIPDNATVCDIDAIRAEIKNAYDDNRVCEQDDVAYGLKVALDIIKEHIKGDN